MSNDTNVNWAERSYNGWPNRETWAVKLWIDNERGSQEYWLEMAKEARQNAVANEFTTAERVAVWALAETLQNEYSDGAFDFDFGIMGKTQSGIYHDLLSAALSSVDWTRIAESLLEDLDENE